MSPTDEFSAVEIWKLQLKPIWQQTLKAKQGEGFYRELDLEFVSKSANAILAIPGWETSRGARAEIEFAKSKGIPIFYPRSPDDLQKIISWAKRV
jgi:hypothetical protein